MGCISYLAECEEANVLLELSEIVLEESINPLFSDEIFLSLNLVLTYLVATNATWELDGPICLVSTRAS